MANINFDPEATNDLLQSHGIALCVCGRELTFPPHCHKCGSINIYRLKKGLKKYAMALASQTGEMPTLLAVQEIYFQLQRNEVKVFSCRHCGEEFTTNTMCTAPPPYEAPDSPLLRKAKRAVQGLPNDEVVTALEYAKRVQQIQAEAKANGEDIDLYEARRRYVASLKGLRKASEAKDPRIP